MSIMYLMLMFQKTSEQTTIIWSFSSFNLKYCKPAERFFLSGKSSGPWFHCQARQRRAAQDAWWWDESHLAGVEIRGIPRRKGANPIQNLWLPGFERFSPQEAPSDHKYTSPSYIPYPVMEDNEATNNSPFGMEIHHQSVCDRITVYIIF